MLAAENVRFILGLKLKRLRHEKGASLKEVAQRSGLSVSYLSEIEKGKKYPKPEKLLELAAALDVPFDELVSMKVGSELDPLKEVFASPFIREFPFGLFGLETQDLFGLITGDPVRAGALIHTLLDIGRMYNVQVEHFLFAALRSYQQMHQNYFEELEEAARSFRKGQGWSSDNPVSEEGMRRLLEERHGYRIDEETLPAHPELYDLRSVFAKGAPPRLYVNGRLHPSQKAFIYGRELGFQLLGLVERPRTSSWIKAASFDEVLNNFRASYFSGALLMDRRRMEKDLAAFFARTRWEPAALLGCLPRYNATPEMFFYRLTELVPKLFDLREIYFVRFHNVAGTESFRLTKVLNLSRAPVPHGLQLREHNCRRWPDIKGLVELAGRQQNDRLDVPLLRAQRSYFVNDDTEFFVVSMARPLSLLPDGNTSVSLGFLLDDRFRETVRFWEDPAIPRVAVNLTCERCPLTPEECQDRAAPPVVFRAQQNQERKEAALAELLQR
jgi:transcriptional regulator with XRE-family HTH domain